MPEQTTPQESSGLTLQDLVLVAQIIQMSSAKGVFRAEDLAQVGSLYNRLIGFLESTGAISRNTPADAQPPADSAEAPEQVAAPAETDTVKEKKNAKARR